MAAVTLNNVCKSYGDRQTVQDVSLSVVDKEFMVLVGPSGCGKSTMLRMIAGLEDVTSGEILIAGHDVTHVAPQKRDIAMVFQSYALYPHMTAYRNMAFGLMKTTRLSKQQIDARVREAAEILHITDLLDRRPKELSGGERQRVAIGRALVRQPKVFLFDEPLSNLDAKLRNRMRGELKRLHDELGLTVIYVTHDQLEAMTLGTRVAVMSKGEVQQVGSPMDIYLKPANIFVASFIGVPEMALISCQGEAGGLVAHPAFSQPLALSNKSLPDRIMLGVRPEEIKFDRAGHVRGKVGRSEFVGAEALVEVFLGSDKLIVKSGITDIPEAGSEIGMNFDMARVRLFDAKTGQSIETAV